MFGELCGDGLIGLSVGFGSSSGFLLFGFPELLRSFLSLGFEIGNELLLFPSVLGSEITKNAGVSVGFHSKNFESLWDNHSLLLVVWEWDTLENLQSVKGGLSSGGFVW